VDDTVRRLGGGQVPGGARGGGRCVAAARFCGDPLGDHGWCLSGKGDGVAAAERDVACGEGGAFGGDVVDEKAGGGGIRRAAGAGDGVILDVGGREGRGIRSGVVMLRVPSPATGEGGPG